MVNTVADKKAPNRQIDWKAYSGELSLNGEKLAVGFRASADERGEIELEFDTIDLNEASKFILLGWRKENEGRATRFALTGIAQDGTGFATAHLYFSSLGRFVRPSGTTLKPIGKCLKAGITFKLVHPAEKPALEVRLKGFQCFRTSPVTCELGQVRIAGTVELADSDIVTGRITIVAQTQPKDIAAWQIEAERLAEHVRLVMSFANSSNLRNPLISFYSGETLTVTARSQSTATPPTFPVIHYLDLGPILQAAVKSFFHPPIAANRLFFAIEWFSMTSSYNEVRLVAAMTAIENLIDSNATEAEEFILPKPHFNKMQKVLLNIIRACLLKWEGSSESVLKEIRAALSGLNRRSLLRKMKLLAQRWDAPLDGISDEGLRAAKSARDHIVHRGHYTAKANADLHTHVILIREVAVRFVLTAIGFQGRYISHIGGYHLAEFPPIARTRDRG